MEGTCSLGEVGQVSFEAVVPGPAGALEGPTSARWLWEGSGCVVSRQARVSVISQVE